MPIPTPQKRAGLTNIKFSMCRLISTKTKEKLKEKLVVMHLGKNADLPYQYNKGKKKTKKKPPPNNVYLLMGNMAKQKQLFNEKNVYEISLRSRNVKVKSLTYVHSLAISLHQ